MAFVHDDQVIFREIIHQGKGRLSRLLSRQEARIVLNAGAEARLPHHLHVIAGALVDPLRFQQAVLRFEPGHPLFTLFQDLFAGLLHLLLRHHIVGGRVNGDMHGLRHRIPSQNVDLRDAVDLVPEEFHPVRHFILVRGKDLQRVSPHPESAAVKIHVVPGVLDVHQLRDHFVAVLLLSGTERDHHVLVIHRAAETVDAGDAGHHDDIVPLQKRAGGGIPQLVDLVVDGGILLDIGIRLRHIGLRLVIIIIGDKVFHRILREEFLHLAVQLGRQRLVVGNDQRRFLEPLDHIRHCKGLAGPGHTHQCLELVAFPEPFHQFFDRLGLVPCRCKI